MKNKNNYILKVYVDSSFEPKTKQAYCCYCLGGLLIDNEEITEFINLGKSSDSAYSEYLGIEKTLYKIKKYLRASNISKSKVKLVIYSDLQSFARQYNKWIPPPKDFKILSCYIRIMDLLSKFHKVDVRWVERGQNIAGKVLEKSDMILKKNQDKKTGESKMTFGKIINF